MDVEIPFIPAPQRSIIVPNEEQDTIVVVGQARKKRKRPKASPDGVDATSGKKTKVINGAETKDDDEGEAFDFSAVPNILDDNPNMGDATKTKKKRERKEKKGVRFYSFCISNHDTYVSDLHRLFFS
jgi:exosome complex exonuclease RRP6